MAVLDKINKMQQQGMSEADITKSLENEGISPKDINDALNQAKVKQAVSQEQVNQTPPAQTNQIPQEMEQSIMQPQPPAPEQPPQEQLPPEQEQPPQEEKYYYPETPQAYPEQAYYPQQPSLNQETVTEIAEQVVLEKFQEFKQKTGDIISFKNQITEKVEDIDNRLKRIEQTIEKLQQAVIGKIGEFGETTSYIHKDLDNLHNTMSKLMNPLIDNYKELKKITKSKD